MVVSFALASPGARNGGRARASKRILLQTDSPSIPAEKAMSFDRLALFRALLIAIFLMPFVCTAHDVVIERNVNLRVGPSTQTEVVQLLRAGDQARLLDLEKQNNYYTVLHNPGVGWVWSNNVKVLPEYLRKQWKH